MEPVDPAQTQHDAPSVSGADDHEEITVPKAYRFGDFSRWLRGSKPPRVRVRVPKTHAEAAKEAARRGFRNFARWMREHLPRHEQNSQLDPSEDQQQLLLACSSVTGHDPSDVVLGVDETEHLALETKELKEGDIVIVTDTRTSKSFVNRIITTAQSSQGLLFHAGQRNAVHAAIIARGADGNLCLVDVTGKGCHIKEIPERFPYTIYVYRMLRGDLAVAASQIALEVALCGKEVEEDNSDRPAETEDDDNDNNDKTDESEEYFDADIWGPLDSEVGDSADGSGGGHRRHVKYSLGGTVRSIVFPQLFFGHHYRTTEVNLRTFCSKFVIECMQVAQHRKKEALKSADALTKDVEEDIESSFWIERTSTVRALEHYLRFNALFRRFVIPASGNLFQTLIVNELVPSCENYEDASACLNDLVTECESYNLNSLGSDFELCCLILRQVIPLLDRAKARSVLKAARRVGGFEIQDLDDARLNALKRKCFAAVEQAEETNTEINEEDRLVISYMGI